MTPEQAVKTLQDALLSHQQGDLSKAETMYDEVLQHQPSMPDAWHMKAQIELGRGAYDKAEKFTKKALELHSATPVYWTTLGNVYLQALNYAEAEKAFQDALGHDAGHVHALQGLGVCAQEQHKDDEALHHLNMALTLDENLPISLVHRAVVRLRHRQYQLAEMDLKKALSIVPEFLMAKLYMGLLLNSQSKGEEALRYFADLYNAGYRVAPLYNAYASVQLQLGHKQQASMIIEEGVKAFPDDMGLQYQRIRIKKVESDDENVVHIRQALETLPDTNPDKYKAAYTLAAIYENSNMYEESLELLKTAGRLKRPFLSYEESNTRAHISAMKTFFTKEKVVELSGSGLSTEKPVFILGMPRSGTTLVEQILSTSTDVYGAGELNHLQQVLGLKKTNNLFKDFSDWAEPVTADKLKTWAQEYLALASAEDPQSGAKFVSDKMPSNALLVGFIKLMFPHAKIIHCERSGMDTCLSCFQKNFTHGQGFSYDLDELGRYYMMHEELMAYWHELFDDIYTVKYEDMVADQEAESKKLFAYVGLEWVEEALEFHKSTRSVHTASLSQVRQPIYTGSVDKWRRYGSGLKPLADILGESL